MPEIATSLAPILGIGAGGAGAIGNIMSMIQQGQQYSKLKSFENMTPQQLSARVAAGTQPLSAGLKQAVTNSVQGADAERGLATSPGIFNADLSQSLAPFVQQNQQTALQMLMAQMGLPVQASSLLRQQPLGNSMAGIMKYLQPQQSTVPSDPNAFMNLIWGGGGGSDSGAGITDSPIDYGGGGSGGGGGVNA